MPAPSRGRCVLFAPAGSEPASGAPVFGLRVVERTVLGFVRAGVREFVVCGDPAAVARTVELLDAGRCAGASVRSAAPGESLVALADGPEPCFFARTDHLYDRRTIERFVEASQGALATVAAVDFRAQALAGQDGAPRIAGWQGMGDPPEAPGASLRVARQGLLAPEGVLAGLARVQGSFFRAFEDAPAGCRSLHNALTLLARREPVATWAVSGPWQAVRSGPGAREEDLALVRRKVLAGAVGMADGVVTRYLNRPLSLRITERLLSRDVRPWHISVASFLAVLGAGLSFAVGHAGTGGLIAQFASVLDGVDGEIARIRYQDSPFGGVYDALLDRIGDAALIGGMTFYAWIMGAGHSAVALGFGAVAGSSLSMLVKEKYGTQFHRTYGPDRERKIRWLLLGRDGRLFLTLVAGITGHVEAVLAYLAVGTHVQAGVRLYRIRSEAAQAA